MSSQDLELIPESLVYTFINQDGLPPPLQCEGCEINPPELQGQREEGGLSHAGHRMSMDSITYCLVSPKYHRLHLLPCVIRDLSAGNDESVHCPMQWKITAFACTASTPPYYGLTLLFLLHWFSTPFSRVEGGTLLSSLYS